MIPSQLCDDCKASGLPILPVRYGPVPNGVAQQLPGWTKADRVGDVALGSEFHYALRTLRAGYVYLFYSKNARGSNLWECYMVSEDGLLIKQPDPLMAPSFPQPTMSCQRQGHRNARLQHLVIERPDLCGPTWIAFSERKWSKETIKEYTGNQSLRDARMQALDPAKMAAGDKHAHGTPATEVALNEVIEYAANFSTSFFPHRAPVPVFSKEDGSYDANRIPRVSTLFPWHQRQGQAAEAVKVMRDRAKRGDGSANTPHILALWDAVGTARELNGFRNDAAGWISLYGRERELQLSASNTLAGLQKALADLAGDTQKRVQDEKTQIAGNWYVPQEAAQRRAQAEKLKEPQRSRDLEICDIVEYWGSQRISVKGALHRLHEANAFPEPKRSKQIAGIKAEVERSISIRAQAGDENIRYARAEAWPKYQSRIDAAALTTFDKHWAALRDIADGVIDRRTEALIRWLEAPLFIDTLEDFSHTNIHDGVSFDDLIGEVTFGMGASQSGQKKIKEWVKQANADIKKNLMWRTVALNQKEGIAALNAALKEAEKHRADQTLARAVTWTGYTAKMLKGLADTYKKAQGVFDANDRAVSQAGAFAFGAQINPVRTLGTDKAVISFGNFIFRHFALDKLGDYASEKIIQHIFSMRAFVSPLDSERLVHEQALAAEIGREQMLRRLRTTQAFMKLDSAELRSAQTEALRDAWSKFKTSGDPIRVGQAIKDTRLALVVALIEGVNFAKLAADCRMKGDGKSYFSLIASSMTITSALFDVAATVVKNLPAEASTSLPKLGPESWTYQALKGWGGLLSGGASFVGAGIDFVDADSSYSKGYKNLFALYLTKAVSGIAAGGLTFAVTFTYAAPLVSRLTGRAAAGAAIEAVGARAAAIIGFRILGMAAGGWITFGMLAIQVTIWIVTPNALQEWVDHAAFGLKRESGGYKTTKEQEEKLGQALVAMGLA